MTSAHPFWTRAPTVVEAAGARYWRRVEVQTGGRPDAGPQDTDDTEYVLVHEVERS